MFAPNVMVDKNKHCCHTNTPFLDSLIIEKGLCKHIIRHYYSLSCGSHTTAAVYFH